MDKELIDNSERHVMTLRIHPQLAGRLALYASMFNTSSTEVICNLIEDHIDEVAEEQPQMKDLFQAADAIWLNQRLQTLKQ